MTVQLALTPDNRWNFATAELVSAAREAGFASVGINADRVDSAAAGAYAASAVGCHEVMALVVSDDVSATVTAAERLAETAKTMRAPWVLTVFATPPATDVIRRCAALFGDAGAGVAVEFSPLGPIASMRDGMQVMRSANAGGGRAALMIDSWHFCFGESTWEDLATVPLDDISYVQFADALAPESDRLVRETLHRRAVPGDGVLELERFAGTLLDRGWDGTVSVEVLSAQLRTLPVDVLTRRLYESTAAYWPT